MVYLKTGLISWHVWIQIFWDDTLCQVSGCGVLNECSALTFRITLSLMELIFLGLLHPKDEGTTIF
jgi:hypothetical protein